MKKIVKWFLVFVVVVPLSPFMAFGAYLVFEIAPNLGDIEHKLAIADKENQNPSQMVKNLIMVSVSTESKPSWSVARALTSSYQENESGFVKYWQLQWLAWYVFVDTFYSKEKVFGLFCTLIYNGDGQGLNELSVRLFNKPLSELTKIEAAEVVAYTRGPSYYGRSKERLHRMRDLLLERVQKLPYNNSHHSPH